VDAATAWSAQWRVPATQGMQDIYVCKLHTELLDYNLRSIALTYVKSSVNVSVAVMWPWFDLHIWCCRGRDGAFLLEFQCGRIAVATPGGISW
jgi:hypothetical protein